MAAPRVRVKVVHEVAAADDQYALVPKGRQFPADIEMKLGWLRLIDAELDDRNVGRGINVLEHGPCAVIEAPGIVEHHVEGREQALDAARERGLTRRRILHLI